MNRFKIFENVQQARSFLRENDIPETDLIYVEIRELLRGNEGYVGWLTRMAYDDIRHTSNNFTTIKNELKSIVDKIKNNPNVISKMDMPVMNMIDMNNF